MKYDQIHDGDWIKPRHRGWRMLCCHCRLVHIVDFKVIKGHVHLRARVCKRATAAARRKKK